MNFDYDHWVGFAEYTWLRNSSLLTSSLTSVFNFNLFNDDLSFGPYGGNRHIDLDMIDATLSRPFYEGRNLIVSPYSGVRCAWLRQNFRGTATRRRTNTYTHSNSHSWLLGPCSGICAQWMIGWGFRLESDLGGEILFQRYKTNFRPGPPVYRVSKQNQLSPVFDAQLGLGWGTYLGHQNFHLDFAATYDFMNWWGQNFIRAIADAENSGISSKPGSLQISGLTLTSRFDF